MNVHPFVSAVRDLPLTARTGRVRRILPTSIEADGPDAPLGALCSVQTLTGSILAEVAGVHADHVVLTPVEDGGQTFSGALVTAVPAADGAPVGDALLGRAVDAFGRPLDDAGPILGASTAPLEAAAASPLARVSPGTIIETGIRVVDGLLTLGHGQRVGVFAAAGVGKTSLMTQLAQQVRADKCVVCLVGERGREVEALWSRGLSAEAKSRSVLVAATSDQLAAMRVRACRYALALAEHWRKQGQHVLLLLDSVTRLAMALREIGLAAGEPPTVRAYTPGVFAAIPRLVERCGALKTGGSITAVMTVLAETDDVDDPISEMMKSLLDGHVILSRTLAEQGHFPAIDAPRSVSRLASSLMSASHRQAATEALRLLSTYETSRTLIETGVYMPGASKEIDEAIERRPGLQAFLRQRPDEFSGLAATQQALAALLRKAA
ncbi:flagellar protein FliI [Caulobacter vibrioides]|nr:flagellar protein FliI [Caulobacter vibrioides]